MKKVFISYSSAEYEHASKYRQAFTEKGIHCWMAPESIPVGSNYAIEIPKAIQDAQVFVLILSENSQNSKWVRKEIDLAVNLNKAIFPVRISNGQLISPFSFYLADVQMIQATDDTEIVTDRLLAILNPNEAKTGFEAVPAPETAVQAASKNSGENKFIDFIKSHKVPVIAAAAVAAIVIGVGAGVALSSGGNNAPADESGVVTEVKEEGVFETTTESAAEDTNNSDSDNADVANELEFTLVYGAKNVECAGTYSGETLDGKTPHGNGKFVGKDSNGADFTYEGNFNNGVMEGNGVQTIIYLEGSSLLSFFIEGVWKDGDLSIGKETTKYANGDVISFEGTWVDGLWSGQGVHTCSYHDGTLKIFESNYVKGKRNGHGTEKSTFPKGNELLTYNFEGEYVDDVATSGKETFVYANGDVRVYEGSWGAPFKWGGKGKETMTYANGDTYTYEGDHKDGKRTGYGVWARTYVDRNFVSIIYEGDFVENEVHGKGKENIEWSNGTFEVCEGEWTDDKFTGKGSRLVTWDSGSSRLLEGTFTDKKLNGFGKSTYTWVSGEYAIYEGEFKDSVPFGPGKETKYDVNGNVIDVIEGNFVDWGKVE